MAVAVAAVAAIAAAGRPETRSIQGEIPNPLTNAGGGFFCPVSEGTFGKEGNLLAASTRIAAVGPCRRSLYLRGTPNASDHPAKDNSVEG